MGKEDLQRALNRELNLNKAKNVIFFLGDGMGVSTVTAARIHAGQKLGQLGEENYLSFEKFPNLGLLKVKFKAVQSRSSVTDQLDSKTIWSQGIRTRNHWVKRIPLHTSILIVKCTKEEELDLKPS